MSKYLGFAALLVFLISGLVAYQHSLDRISSVESALEELTATVGRNHADAAELDAHRLRLIQRIDEMLQALGEADEALAQELERFIADLAELDLRIQLNESALGSAMGRRETASSISPSEEPKAVVQDPLAATAELMAQEALAESAYPFMMFDDMPQRAKDDFAQWKDQALFVEYPDNIWNDNRVGRVRYMVKGEQGWQREHVNDDNIALLQRLAELCYDIEAMTEERLLQLKSAGDYHLFASRADATPHISARANENPGPFVRVDPSTGEAYVFDGSAVHDYPPLIRLYDEREAIGRQLLAGRAGSYGVRWVDVAGY